MTAANDGGPRFFPALRNGLYARYIAGSTACSVAIWIQRTAMGWSAWELTGSGAWLGLVSFAYLVPLVVIGPIGGAIADRFDNMRMITMCQASMALAALILTGFSVFDARTIGILIAISAVQGVTEAFSQTAQLTLVPLLVPRRDLTAAVATASVSFNTARFIGPAIGGGIIAAFGTGTAFAVSALGFLTFLVVLLVIYPRVEQVERPPSGRFLGALAEGVVYTAKHPGIGPMMLMVIAVGSCGRPVVELFPGFAEQIFDAGAMGLAALTSSVGIGAVLSGLRLSGARKSDSLPGAMLISTAAAAVLLWAFLLAPNIYAAFPILVLLGFCTSTTGISVQTMINLAVEDHMRGRVLSLFGVCFRGSPALGALIMGALSDYVGLRLPVLGGSILLLIVWALLRRRVARLSRYISDE